VPGPQAAHVAAALELAPTAPKEPAAHGAPAHAARPLAAVKVPGPQTAHVAAAAVAVPSGPKRPAAQGAPAKATAPAAATKAPLGAGMQAAVELRGA